MTMGIMPITGIPLPFLSHGGSSTVVAFGLIGLVINMGSIQNVKATHVWKYKETKKIRKYPKRCSLDSIITFLYSDFEI